jgi:hypothetical protein
LVGYSRTARAGAGVGRARLPPAAPRPLRPRGAVRRDDRQRGTRVLEYLADSSTLQQPSAPPVRRSCARTIECAPRRRCAALRRPKAAAWGTQRCPPLSLSTAEYRRRSASRLSSTRRSPCAAGTRPSTRRRPRRRRTRRPAAARRRRRRRQWRARRRRQRWRRRRRSWQRCRRTSARSSRNRSQPIASPRTHARAHVHAHTRTRAQARTDTHVHVLTLQARVTSLVVEPTAGQEDHPGTHEYLAVAVLSTPGCCSTHACEAAQHRCTA